MVLIYISILFSYSPFCFPHPEVPYHPPLWSASPSCTFWIDSCKFCPNFAQLQGIHIVFIMIKVNIIFFIKLLKGEAGGWTAIKFVFVFFTLIFPDQHHVKEHPQKMWESQVKYYCPPDQIGLERIIINPRLILHGTKILFDSSQLWLQVHPMCANYRFWY